MVFQDILVVLIMHDGSLVDHDFRGVPLLERILVLRNGGNHVVQRRALSVPVFSELRIRMVGVVQNLIFRGRNVDGLVSLRALFILRHDFTREVEYAGVASLGDLPVEFELEVLELGCKDDIAAFQGLCLARTRAGEFQTAVLDGPARRNGILAVTPPSIQSCSVKEDVVSLFIHRKGSEINLRLGDDGIGRDTFFYEFLGRRFTDVLDFCRSRGGFSRLFLVFTGA